MKIAILGAAGYLGKRLIEKLLEDNTILYLKRMNKAQKQECFLLEIVW